MNPFVPLAAHQCSQSTFRLVSTALLRMLRSVTDVLAQCGFELAHRLSLSRLAELRLGVKASDVEVLFFTHPLLLLQYFSAGGEPALLFPFVGILRAQDERSCRRSGRMF
ncbi:MAG TPA: hypothetical protein VLK65_02760 [Vicinamibacteria bacterium]|nr:hypothetical protein [Vicinamibacteria bacterium]